MPRALSLFLLPRGRTQAPEDILSTLHGASLKELKAYFEEAGDKASLRRLENLSKIVVGLNGRLSSIRGTTKDARLRFSYTFRGKFSYVRGGERRIEEYEIYMEHDVWIRVISGLLIIFDAPNKRIARAIAQLASLRLYGDTTSASPLHLERSHINALEKWVTAKEHEVSGNIIRATFKRARIGDTVLDEVSIKREGLDITDIYSKVKSSAHEISSITFVTPLLPEIGKRITCKLDSRGGLLIYTPNLREVDIEVVLSKLENVMGFI